jgi:CHAT domain-containing protein
LGLPCEALPDRRKAFFHEEKTGFVSDQLLTDLGNSERFCGNIPRGIELLERAAKNGHIGSNELLTWAYLAVGDITSAIRAKDRSVELSQAGLRQRSSASPQQTTWLRFHLARANAAILRSQGKYQEEEKFLRIIIAERPYIIGTNPNAILGQRTTLAFNLSRQGRLAEAELEARAIINESIGLAGKKGELTAYAVGTLADIMLGQGRYEEAEKLARSQIKIFESIGLPADTRYNAEAHISLGNTLVIQGKYAGAFREYDFVRESLKDNRSLYDNNYSRNPDLILTLIKTGRTDEALKLIDPAREAAGKYFGEKSLPDAELLGFRGMARQTKKQYAEALSDFNQAVPVLSDQRDLGFRGRIILEAYLDLLSLIQGTSLEQKTGDAATTAFHVANLLASSTVHSALGESNARAAAAYDPDLADLVRKEQDMHKQVTALEMTLSNVMAIPVDQQSPEGVRQLKENIATLTRARIVLKEEISRRFPKYADFISPKTVSAPDIQRVLRSGEALLTIYTTDEKTFVWAIPQQGEIRFHTAPLGRKDLERIVIDIRKSLDANPSTFGDIPEFDTALAYRLYAEILKPVDEGWENASDLFVVNSGPIGQISLSLLPTEPVHLADEKGELFANYREVPWLIRKVSVTMIPSVNALVTLRSLPESDPKRKAFAGFGDPIFNLEQLAMDGSSKSIAPMNKETTSGNIQLASRGLKLQVRGVRITGKGNLDDDKMISAQLNQLGRLPDTAEEIRSIAKVLDADADGNVFLGKDFSHHRLKSMNLSDRRVIAFATHALVPGDLDGLDQPALALSSPAVTGEKEDGLLTMDEILKLKLNADWVVLSACNTGASEGKGAEAVSGLGKAFFYAGTRALLVTMWSVETTSARKLVTGIFQSQEENKASSRAQALRKSMLNLIDKETLKEETTGKIAASYAHPLFWAPFIIVGDPGKSLE